MLLNKKCVSNSYILIYFGFLTKTTIIDLYTMSHELIPIFKNTYIKVKTKVLQIPEQI